MGSCAQLFYSGDYMQTDVLIVGAGPTGLVLAIELLKRHIPVRIVEKLPTPQQQSRALGIQARTLEIFEKVGVIEKILQRGKSVNGMTIHKGRAPLFTFTISPANTAYPFVFILPQSETESILTEKLESLGGHVERNSLLTMINDTTATIVKPNGEEELITAKYIIGCDGAHSTVRHVLGLPFKGSALAERFLLADVEADVPFPLDKGNLFLGNTELLLLILLPVKDKLRLIALLHPDSPVDEKELDIDFLQKLLSLTSQTQTITIKNIAWVSRFSVHRRMVPTMDRNPIFLAGDAAHIHSPAGGQGMNTSIQDAFNLAWKLALVIQKKAGTQILSTYTLERLPIAKKVLRGTSLLTKIISKTLSYGAIFLFLGKYLLKIPKVKRALSQNVSELSYHYAKSPLSSQSKIDKKWLAPKPGYRAPDVVFENKRLYDFMRTERFILLVFAPKESFPIEQKHLKEIDVLEVSSIEQKPHCLYDPKGEIAKEYDADSSCFFLIRPDGYISYRRKQGSIAEFTLFLEKIFL